MRETVSWILEAYGQTVTATVDGEEQTWRAFVQPVLRERSAEERAYTPIGDVDERQWLYIGPADRPLERGERLQWGGKALVVRESAVVYGGTEIIYRRAVLLPDREAAV